MNIPNEKLCLPDLVQRVVVQFQGMLRAVSSDDGKSSRWFLETSAATSDEVTAFFQCPQPVHDSRYAFLKVIIRIFPGFVRFPDEYVQRWKSI